MRLWCSPSSSTSVSSSRFSIETLLHISKQRRNRHIHGVVGSAAVVGTPLDASIGADYEKGMAVAGFTHHAILIGVIRSGHCQARVGEDRRGETLVSDLLFQGIQRVRSDAHHGIDAERSERLHIRFNIFDLCPAWLAGYSFLEKHEHCLAPQRGQIKGTTIRRWQPDGWSLLT